jgi:L-iditol 2-dehydrogenase
MASVPKSMKVALYDGQGGINLTTSSTPDLMPGAAMLRIRACGIAVSDLRAYKAKLANKLFHKLAGEIVQVTPEVNGLDVGARVYINSYYHCGECLSCRRGFTNLCAKRTYFYDGKLALSEYAVLPPKFLQAGGATQVLDGVSFQDATHVGPLSNCLNTLRAVEFAPGNSAVVIGAGPMGLLHTLLLRASGASEIIVTDVDESRLEKSKEFGSDHVVNARSADAVDEVLRLTDGGADVIIVATGRPEAMLNSIRMVKPRGRIDLFGGVALEPGDSSFKIDPNPIHYKELKMVGTYASLLDDYRTAAELISSRKISPSKLDTHEFDFDYIKDALSVAENPEVLRVLIHV